MFGMNTESVTQEELRVMPPFLCSLEQLADRRAEDNGQPADLSNGGYLCHTKGTEGLSSGEYCQYVMNCI